MAKSKASEMGAVARARPSIRGVLAQDAKMLAAKHNLASVTKGSASTVTGVLARDATEARGATSAHDAHQKETAGYVAALKAGSR